MPNVSPEDQTTRIKLERKADRRKIEELEEELRSIIHNNKLPEELRNKARQELKKIVFQRRADTIDPNAGLRMNEQGDYIQEG